LLLAAECLLYGALTLATGYWRQAAWRQFAVGAGAWQEIDKVPYASLINRYARAEGVSARLVAAIIQAESSFQPRAVSPAGAAGLMQVIPGTWRLVNDRIKACSGRHAGGCGPECYFDPELNIRIGTAYVAELSRRFGDPVLALAAYNAGPAAVERYGGIPPFAETEEYVRRVAQYWWGYGGVGVSPVDGVQALQAAGRLVLVAVAVTLAATLAVGWRLRLGHGSWRWR
jgi:soluble lytic murein transglycosylase-like protein